MTGPQFRSAYVSAVRRLRRAAEDRGVTERLAQRTDPVSRHARSLLAIHDVEAMIELGLPWWTYRAAEAIDRFLSVRTAPRVFEFGSGASTVWLAERAAEVVSVEHSAEFAAILRPLLPANAQLIEVAAPTGVPIRTPSRRTGESDRDFTAYLHALDDVGGDFDLVVVDGRARIACATRALTRLRAGGAVLLDDAWRQEYREGIRRLPVSVARFWGAAPCLPYPSMTAVLRPTPGAI